MYKDFKNNPLSVGDHVIYIANRNNTPKLALGIITSLFKNRPICTINSNTNVPCDLVAKLPVSLPELRNSPIR